MPGITSTRRPLAWAARAALLLSAPLLLLPLAAPAAAPSAAAAAPTPAPVAAIGSVLPNLSMAGLNGPPRSLSSYRGRPLLINVWASWCSPCRKEAASLERLAWSEAGSRLTVIGVSTDDRRAAALSWLQQSNATISHFIDSAPHWPLEHTLGASSIPVTVLVDAQGRVVARFRGARDWSSADSVQLIETAFAGAGRRTTTAAPRR